MDKSVARIVSQGPMSASADSWCEKVHRYVSKSRASAKAALPSHPIWERERNTLSYRLPSVRIPSFAESNFVSI